MQNTIVVLYVSFHFIRLNILKVLKINVVLKSQPAVARSLSSASLSLLSSCIVIIIIIKGKSVTYIAARRGEVQPLLVYHRTVVILKGLDRVVELRYIQPGLVLGPVAV